MKKTLVSALTTALVVGAASTTFAAANPFEDVPADHWAYDAIAQLAADGVIEGYGDGTYRGDQEITRYEMAQMIARAMAKGGGDKALIDKLAAEFADELNNLGVRVAALEKKVDNVKWTGMVRYRYINRHEEGVTDRGPAAQKRWGGVAQQKGASHQNTNGLLLRLEPQMMINKNWTAKARIDYNDNTEMDTAKNNNSVEVDRIWAEGKYNNFLLKLGKFNVKPAADYGMTMDYRIAGGEVVIGKEIQFAARGGRLNLANASGFAHGGNDEGVAPAASANSRSLARQYDADGKQLTDDTVNYVGVEVYSDRSKKFTWGLGWQYIKGDKNRTLQGSGADALNIWNVGLGYKFTKEFNATAAYAFATGLGNDDEVGVAQDGTSKYNDGKFKNSYAIQLNYRGADKAKPGSWGAFVAWRQLGDWSTIHPTCRENGAMNGGEKGWEIGFNYTFAKNILGKAQYFNGKEIGSDHKVNAVWTEIGFYF